MLTLLRLSMVPLPGEDTANANAAAAAAADVVVVVAAAAATIVWASATIRS